jgi:hypothetical protein
MDSWVWDQVNLEFSNINIKGTVESEEGILSDIEQMDELKLALSWSHHQQEEQSHILKEWADQVTNVDGLTNWSSCRASLAAREKKLLIKDDTD